MAVNLGWRIDVALYAAPEEVQKTQVDCGTCPVSLQCANGDGGNGWKFSCCGSVGIEVAADGGRVLLIMDCADNRFTQRDIAAEQAKCPLCNGDIVKSDVLGMGDHHRYVPTVHAKVPVPVRLALWRKVLPKALDLKTRIAKRAKP